MKNDTKVNEINPRYSESALKEKALLKELNAKPASQKFAGYLKLSGPGFMNAAFTLGAGSFASSVTLGAAYGYDIALDSLLFIFFRSVYACTCNKICYSLRNSHNKSTG